MSEQASEITLRVRRGDPEQGPRLEEYRVPCAEGMSLLDALAWLREEVDPSLAVRFSCRSANACKECSASIDGKPGYLCVTKARPATVVTIEPLPTRRWLRDVAVALDAEGRA